MTRYDIAHLPPYDSQSGHLNAIIETPKGSRSKFKYDEKHGLFMFDKALPLGTTFPFDFGFLPSTIGEDGDPLDVLVLGDEPSFAGCLVLAKLLGVIEAEQTDKDETNRNDRFIAVPLEVESRKPARHWPDSLSPAISDAIIEFFVAYNDLQDKKFNVLRCSSSSRAMELIKQGFAKARRGKKKRRS